MHAVQELEPLARLPRLSEVSLYDPLWGGCPLAALPNYHTYALCLLPGLTCLDTLPVAPETRAAAAATLAKKQVSNSLGRHLECDDEFWMATVIIYT
jgi:hypothetical protein